MTDQAAADLPDIAELEAMPDPVECARRITQLARSRGNLPAPYAHLRIKRLLEARIRDGRKVTWLALKVGLRASGISRLTGSAFSEGATAP